jgi:hypothetical protein
MRVFQRQQVGERDQRPDSLHLFQPCHLGVASLGQVLDPLVGFASLLAQRFERVDNLGAYRIPPETGILIPSANASYQN